ncbi:helix-turn-helix domain-containing protein, partial [Bifidobacterium mongoliense]
MSRVYSHIGEEERQVIQIQVGNGATVRAIGRHAWAVAASSISREIRRNTWFPSN